MVFTYVAIFLQSLIAMPRPLSVVFMDTWEMLAIIIPVLLVVARPTQRSLFVVGWLFLLAGVSRAFLGMPGFVKQEYATLLSLGGIWLVGEWFNVRTFGRSLLTELLAGNYHLAAGIFLSTVVLGAVVEFLNALVALWWYRWPFPSLEIMDMPVFLAAFGWFPWILAMFVIFYPFAMFAGRRGTSRNA